MIENMLTNLRAMRVRYRADLDVDLPAQARLLEFDTLTKRGLSAPFGGAFDSADMFYLPGADGAAGSLRVLRHDEANPAARKALRADLLEEGYVPLDEVSVMTLPGLAAECAAKRAAAAERAAAAVAAETAADDAAAEAHSAAAIRAAVSGGPASTTVCRVRRRPGHGARRRGARAARGLHRGRQAKAGLRVGQGTVRAPHDPVRRHPLLPQHRDNGE
mmetsp:Transcript_31904/g.112254  ORF Transcript_31904/g.112254 Transcript_31904/m.112254 type:complete len:218 (-) Transcript_31904:214-867(-)